MTGLRRDTVTFGERLRHIDRPEVHEVLRGLRGVLDEYGDYVAVGEVGIWDLPRMLAYYGSGDELHMAFNFPFWEQPWSAAGFRSTVDAVEAALPTHAWPAYALSNHDLSRAATRYDPGGDRPECARLAAMMTLTLRGTPFLYYGEEIGMTDVDVPKAQRHDPGGRDPERTPMQWTSGPQAGFSRGVPWLPVPDSARTLNVENQRADSASLLSFYRALIRLRRTYPTLHAGSYLPLDGGPEGLYAFERRHGSERLLVGLNFADGPAGLNQLPLPPEGVVALSTNPDRPEGPADIDKLWLTSCEGILVRLS